eukprot:Sspe_Gene.106533::Locus_84611_Transcript_1_1_Confidence_1.000_Length_582::g.106533::m.106533/K17609/NXN; nucleoredoxin
MLNEDEKQFEVVLVSADESAEQMQRYQEQKQGDWLRVPYDSPLRLELPKRYGTFAGRHAELHAPAKRRQGIPGLVVINSKGDELVFNGVEQVNSMGPAAVDSWGKWDE